MPEIKERPILFSAPMVRAILEGRKTVTRREIKQRTRSADTKVELHQQSARATWHCDHVEAMRVPNPLYALSNNTDI